MKKLTFVLVAAALMVSAHAQARMLSTKAECVAACTGNGTIDDSCGWITKRPKFNLCRTKLITTCRKWGTDAICPTPTSTTVPPPPTTVPYVPPTTTTVPVVVITNPLAYSYAGTWNVYGTLYSLWHAVLEYLLSPGAVFELSNNHAHDLLVGLRLWLCAGRPVRIHWRHPVGQFAVRCVWTAHQLVWVPPDVWCVTAATGTGSDLDYGRI
jgi:hypothetical protein